jgi:hypothetical protein
MTKKKKGNAAVRVGMTSALCNKGLAFHHDES